MEDLRYLLKRISQSPFTLAIIVLAFVMYPFRAEVRAGLQPFELASFRHFTAVVLSNFFHLDVKHLIYDTIGVLVAGVMLEPLLGRRRYAILLLAILFSVSLASAFVYYPSVPVGLSGIQQGIVGGLIAACLFIFRLYFLGGFVLVFYLWKCVSEVMGQSSYLTVMKWLGVASETFSSVAYWCHIAGMSMGFLVVMSFAFLERRRKDDSSAVT